VGEITNEERSRIKQYANDYDARTLAEMLVGVERSLSLCKEFNRRSIARAEKAEAEVRRLRPTAASGDENRAERGQGAEGDQGGARG